MTAFVDGIKKLRHPEEAASGRLEGRISICPDR
jgi:hypothetical protein